MPTKTDHIDSEQDPTDGIVSHKEKESDAYVRVIAAARALQRLGPLEWMQDGFDSPSLSTLKDGSYLVTVPVIRGVGATPLEAYEDCAARGADLVFKRILDTHRR